MNIVEVKNITKSFKDTIAVDDISFEVNRGELFGLIGPDGAGKTTLFRVMTTLLKPESGSASVLGFDVVRDYKKIRKKVGYMPGRFSLYRDLSVEENLKFFATIFGTAIEENYDLIKDIYVLLEPFKKRKAGKLSGGMKQKLALSCALIHKPEVLFLDEPTTGVDPVSRNEFWEMLRKLKEQGITILVSTPYMDEASLCDRVALVQKGKTLSIDTPDSIIGRFKKPLFAVSSENQYALMQKLLAYENRDTIYPFGDFLHYTDKRESASAEDIRKHIESLNCRNISVKPIKPNIEDCFMALMEEN